MAITRGFGTAFNFEAGAVRNWVMGADGVRRWVDTGEPADWREAL